MELSSKYAKNIDTFCIKAWTGQCYELGQSLTNIGFVRDLGTKLKDYALLGFRTPAGSNSQGARVQVSRRTE
jgi:hypothetical protein